MWDFCGLIGERGSDRVLADGDDLKKARFFPDAKVNFAENLLRERGDEEAIVFHGEDGSRRAVTFDDLRRDVARLQAELRDLGVGPGDRVAGFMPNVPETVLAMLAVSSLGAVWSSCSPDFGVNGVLDRFGQIEPKVMFCADGYFYNGKRFDSVATVAEIVDKMPSVGKVIVTAYDGEQAADISVLGDRGARLADVLAAHADRTAPQFTPMPFNAPLFIMFSSGTTGLPKCIVHGIGGTLIQHLKEHQLHCDVKPGDRVFYFTTCGWMMWNWLVSGLASRATLVLFDGSPFHPDGNRLAQLAAAEGVTHFGTSAKYIDACAKAGVRPIESLDLSALRAVLSTGSPLAPDGFDYIYDAWKKDVCLSSIAGGTDIIGCFTGGNPIGPVHRGACQKRLLGMDVRVFDEEGNALEGAAGELVCIAPHPSQPIGFWNDEDGSRYHNAYFDIFPNVWRHGDWVELTPEGGVAFHGRSDATLNPGGVRIGTAEIYRQVERIPEIMEALVVGQPWDNDVRVVLFVRLRDDLDLGRRPDQAHQVGDPGQHHPEARAVEGGAGAGHPAHQVGQDRRTGGAQRHSGAPGEECPRPGQSGGAGALPGSGGPAELTCDRTVAFPYHHIEMPKEPAPFVLNTDDLDAFIESVADRLTRPGREWAARHLRKFLLSDKRCLAAHLPGGDDLRRAAVARNWQMARDLGLDAMWFEAPPEIEEEVVRVLDWIGSLPQIDPRLAGKRDRIAYPQARAHAEKWHARMARRHVEARQDDPAGTVTVLELDNGRRWIRLASVKALDYEGERMHHCVGDGSYDTFRREIYSLRDADNKPHCTVEFDPSRRRVQQAKGLANGDVPCKYLDDVEVLLRHLRPQRVNSRMTEFVIAHDGSILRLSRSADWAPGTRVHDNLVLTNRTDVTALPESLRVNGSLILANCSLKTLPRNLRIGHSLTGLALSPLESLPEGLRVRTLNLEDSLVKAVAPGTRITKELSLVHSALTRLPEDLRIGQLLIFDGAALPRLPFDLEVAGMRVADWVTARLPETVTAIGELSYPDMVFEDADWVSVFGRLSFAGWDDPGFPHRLDVVGTFDLKHVGLSPSAHASRVTVHGDLDMRGAAFDRLPEGWAVHGTVLRD